MSFRTHPITMAARSFGRKLGLNRVLASFRFEYQYEERFFQQLVSQIRTGDCVWDVGANRGLYTSVFSGKVGDCGHVFAFEPSRRNISKLIDTVRSSGNVEIVEMALGDRDMEIGFIEGEDPLGVTDKIGEGDLGIKVRMSRGDTLIDVRKVRPPNVLKIDVEGFELSVLAGMKVAISGRKELRAIGIEVHFALLEQRGLKNAPKQIESLLSSSGFAVSWPDPSHILALR